MHALGSRPRGVAATSRNCSSSWQAVSWHRCCWGAAPCLTSKQGRARYALLRCAALCRAVPCTAPLCAHHSCFPAACCADIPSVPQTVSSWITTPSQTFWPQHISCSTWTCSAQLSSCMAAAAQQQRSTAAATAGRRCSTSTGSRPWAQAAGMLQASLVLSRLSLLYLQRHHHQQQQQQGQGQGRTRVCRCCS